MAIVLRRRGVRVIGLLILIGAGLASASSCSGGSGAGASPTTPTSAQPAPTPAPTPTPSPSPSPTPSPTPTPPTPPATTYALSCVVQDDDTNAGLSDAQVQVMDGANAGKSTTSGGNGTCSLAGLAGGSMTVRVTRSGYHTLDKSVTLPNDSRIEFKLKPNPSPSPSPSPNPPGGALTCGSSSVPGTVDCGVPTAKCNDGTWSCSQNRSGTCSHHDGVSCWVCPGVLCQGLRAPTSRWSSAEPRP
jgi:hypothetical protein